MGISHILLISRTFKPPVFNVLTLVMQRLWLGVCISISTFFSVPNKPLLPANPHLDGKATVHVLRGLQEAFRLNKVARVHRLKHELSRQEAYRRQSRFVLLTIHDALVLKLPFPRWLRAKSRIQIHLRSMDLKAKSSEISQLISHTNLLHISQEVHNHVIRRFVVTQESHWNSL